MKKNKTKNKHPLGGAVKYKVYVHFISNNFNFSSTYVMRHAWHLGFHRKKVLLQGYGYDS